MTEKPQIIKVKIKLKDVEVEMSIAEVMELRKVLNDNFGKDTVLYPSQPYWPARRWEPYWTTTTSGCTLSINAGTSS